uniref:Uncharacterized protein n=1 Tax=Arundo donax TaxID=35708 RepID=A0A0A9GMV5_ARUDO
MSEEVAQEAPEAL